MKTIKEVLDLSIGFLKQKGVHNSRRQAEEMICDAIGLKRLQLYMEFERPLSEIELKTCRQALARRVKGEPLQYIRGEVEFYDCNIKVSKNVLIPRQETALLVDKIVQELSKVDLQNKVLWDVCCGSGCIGIALKKRFPELDVTLSDLSETALAIAKENAENNKVDVLFRQGDLLAPFCNQKTNFFVCNPPYISQKEFNQLDREVKDYEPSIALIAGATGLEFYERLAFELSAHLHAKGMAWMEIGYSQGAGVIDLFSSKGWKVRRVEQDWSGHDRFFFLENE